MKMIECKRIQYLADSYEALLCDKFETKRSVLLNPHNILLFIIDDLTYGMNERNLKFWKEKFSKIISIDPVFKNNDYLGKKLLEHICSDKEYALQLCNILLIDIEKGRYAKRLCKYICEYCDSSELFNEEERKKIEYLSQSLYIELTLNGYSKEAKKNIFNNLFSKYYIREDYVYTHYPFIPEKICEDDKKIIEYMDNLTEQDRLKDLEKYFEKEEQVYWTVCSLEGLSGEELDIKIGDVRIYNAENFPQFAFEMGAREEGYLGDRLKEKKIHAAIRVESVDIENVTNIAFEELENALDIISCELMNSEPLYIDKSEIAILNIDKNVIWESSSVQDEAFYRKIKGIKYNRFAPDRVEKLQLVYEKYAQNVLHSKDEFARVLSDSVRWFRKGEEAKRKEDKLINYWISLENLFPDRWEIPKYMNELAGEKGKFAVIYSIVPKLFVRKHALDFLWDFYSYIRGQYKEIGISDKLVKKCQFMDWENIFIFNFIDNIELLILENNNDYIKELLIDLQKILKKGGEGYKFVKEDIKRTREDLLMSYRLRNLIVHNAKCKIDFIDYNIKTLRKIVSELHVLFLEKLDCNSSRSEKEILLNQYIKQDDLINKLKLISLREWLDLTLEEN